MGIHGVPWFKERRPHKECTDKMKELKASGQFYNVRVGHSVNINGKRHSKVFVLKKKEVMRS